MYKFIFLTFAFLAWAFYEMSGGANFTPTERVTEAEAPAVRSDSASDSQTAAATTRPATLSNRDLPEIGVEVTRANYVKPSYDLRAPAEEELAAVDPAVLSSFSDVLKTKEEVETIQIAAADDAVVAEMVQVDLREVTGNRVNMRNGPGTSFAVVDSLARGDEVEVLDEPGNGWLKLRVSQSGQVGWMAEFLVSAAE